MTKGKNVGLTPFPEEAGVTQYRGASSTRGCAKGVVSVQWEELEQRFLDVGWELDASFEDYLLIGHDGYRISLLAHKEWWDPDNPIFEILDHAQLSTYWVPDEVPTPQRAAQLLQEHGWPPEERDLP